MAVAISLLGTSMVAILATIVEVLHEVPVMLHPARIANRTAHRFPKAFM